MNQLKANFIARLVDPFFILSESNSALHWSNRLTKLNGRNNFEWEKSQTGYMNLPLHFEVQERTNCRFNLAGRAAKITKSDFAKAGSNPIQGLVRNPDGNSQVKPSFWSFSLLPYSIIASRMMDFMFFRVVLRKYSFSEIYQKDSVPFYQKARRTSVVPPRTASRWISEEIFESISRLIDLLSYWFLRVTRYWLLRQTLAVSFGNIKASTCYLQASIFSEAGSHCN